MVHDGADKETAAVRELGQAIGDYGPCDRIRTEIWSRHFNHHTD